jgi:hypothetical protein
MNVGLQLIISFCVGSMVYNRAIWQVSKILLLFAYSYTERSQWVRPDKALLPPSLERCAGQDAASCAGSNLAAAPLWL